MLWAWLVSNHLVHCGLARLQHSELFFWGIVPDRWGIEECLARVSNMANLEIPERNGGLNRGWNRGLLGNTLINDGFSSMPRLITAKYLDLYIASEDVDVLSTRFQNSETLPHLCRLLVSILYYLGNSSPSHVFFCFKLHVHHISVNTQKWNNKSLQY